MLDWRLASLDLRLAIWLPLLLSLASLAHIGGRNEATKRSGIDKSPIKIRQSPFANHSLSCHDKTSDNGHNPNPARGHATNKPMEPLDLLDGLEIKLRQLAAQSDRQRADYERVTAENQQLKRALDRQTGIVTSLKDKLARGQAGAAPSPPPPEPAGEAVSDDDAGAPPAVGQADRETIEFCIAEIDRCLDWLRRN